MTLGEFGRPRWLRTVTVGMLALAALASCGSDRDDGAQTSSSTTTTTATPLDSASSTSPEPSEAATDIAGDDALPACGDHTSYRTTPDWVIDTPPEGFRVHYARTTVNHYQADDMAGYDTATRFQLAELDPDDVVISTMTVTRFPDLERFEPDPATSAGFAFDRAYDTVRGHQGAIGRVTNRGDLIGWIAARWIEDGVGWIATGDGDVDAVSNDLMRLDLSADGVTDPSGGLRVLGSSPVFEPEDRETFIAFVRSDVTDAGGSDPGVEVTITRQPEGASGISTTRSLLATVGAQLTDHDGRAVLSTRRAVLTTLSDGSLIVVEDSTGTLERDGLIDLVDQVRPVDEAAPYEGPLVPDWSYGEGSGDRCIEG